MARRPRRDEVGKILKNLLDLDLPEIQVVARELTDRIRKLEEHSLKLQDHVARIESLTAEEADAVVESKIGEIVEDLERALGKRRRKPAATHAALVAPAGKVSDTEAKAETEEEVEVRSEGVRLPKYTTPEGLVIRKSRR